MSRAPRKREPLGRTWWRASTGIGTDLKYRTVASMAGPGVDAAQVAGVWLAMLDHAAQSKPRGSIVTFDHRDYAEFSGLDRDVTARIVTALQEKGLHDGHAVTRWADHQAPKVDRTAAERKKKQRERERLAKEGGDTPPNPGELPDSAPCHAVTAVTERDAEGVTARDRQREALAISRQETSSSLRTNAFAATRASAGPDGEQQQPKRQVWHELEALGIEVPGLGKRWRHRATIAGWTTSTTPEQLVEAHRRAQARRTSDGDARPITLAFLEPFVTEVVAGLAPRSAGPAPAPQAPAKPSTPRPPAPPPVVVGDLPEFAAVHQAGPKTVGEAIAALAARFGGKGARS